MNRWQIIRWWEIRRIPYNAALFVIGVTSLVAVEWLQAKTPANGRGPFHLETGLTIVGYVIMANLLYTLGWIVELIGRETDEVRARTRGKKFFLAGMWFSCLLTSAPFWYELVFWLLQRKGQHG